MSIDAKLSSLGIILPAAPKPVAAYVPATLQSFRQMQYRQRVHQVLREFDSDDEQGSMVKKLLSIPHPQSNQIVMQFCAGLGGFALVVYQVGLIILTSNENRYPDRLKAMRVTARVLCALAALARRIPHYGRLRDALDGLQSENSRLSSERDRLVAALSSVEAERWQAVRACEQAEEARWQFELNGR